MTMFCSTVKQSDGVSCRPEDAGTFLLYSRRTDELHIIDRAGKAIFDMCIGSSIDDVVESGSEIIAEQNGTNAEVSRRQVLSFLRELRKRSLVEFR